MKILTFIVIVCTLSLVQNKLKFKKHKQIAKVDQILDVPLHAALPNDGYTLQRHAVFFTLKIGF